jgi:pyruvate formate lyase activating enzyme
VFFEYAYETARLAHHAGLADVFVTNCYMSAAALHHIRPLLDAAISELERASHAFSQSLYGQAASQAPSQPEGEAGSQEPSDEPIDAEFEVKK